MNLSSSERGAGVLLHITSLPSRFGIGDLGPGAYRFVDFLARGSQMYWQVLPLNPTSPESDYSPYHGVSAFAGNPLLISPELMAAAGLLTEEELIDAPGFPESRVDFARVIPFKEGLFDRAFDRFRREGRRAGDYAAFCSRNESWLSDYALFASLSWYYGGKPWNEWPEEIRHRRAGILDAVAGTLDHACRREMFLQYLFFDQWQALLDYSHARGIRIIGDLPLYVTYNSADVWSHPALFCLDADGTLAGKAGVPPDYFNPGGQLWGNPLYHWEMHRACGYRWWMERFALSARLYDMVRFDHFRGLAAYWEVGPDEQTATHGRWVRGPGAEFIAQVVREFSHLSLIAEDLGVITPDVVALMDQFHLPGMRVLLFGFLNDDAGNPNHPDNITPDCVVYTGTHDNNTVLGWLLADATSDEIRRLSQYCARFRHDAPGTSPGREGRSLDSSKDVTNAGCIPADNQVDVPRLFMEIAYSSHAMIAIVPLQDLCGLGSEARMNRPGTQSGNWRWRADPGLLCDTYSNFLMSMVAKYHRSP